jgi:two-component system CheB/CheR fusion protein
MSFPIVGLGASAGGLEALECFFEHVPEDCGQAFVVVQHLSPDFKSVMDQLLSRKTTLSVARVEDGMEVRPGVIYLIPPKKEMIISDGHLLLSDKDPKQSLSLPIDTFFRSLAQDAGERAIAVILSGTGSDGSRGIRDIHEAGGLVIVQRLDSAKFDGMPKSALDTGVVDLELPCEDMHAAIARYAERGLLTAPGDGGKHEAGGVDHIVALLNREYGIDFSQYKPTTLHRRIERRVAINQASSLEAYARTLSDDRRELHHLYKDLLIGVTRFFRDAEAFKSLKQRLSRDLIDHLNDRDELRVWVAGCATGEEAYSLAILIHEALDRVKRRIEVKIFATDVHAASLEAASAGVFNEASLEGMDPAYLERYFTRHEDGRRVISDLRQMIVFAPHNLLKDAPFTKMDLITCRNLLIYLEPHAQKKVLTLFHFALKPRGLLMLGQSESPGELAEEFETVDLHAKIFQKSRDVRLPHDVRLIGAPALPLRPSGRGDRPSEPERWLAAAREQLLDEFAPPSLLIDQDGTLVHAFAGGGKYLAHADGRSSLCVLDLVPSDLKVVLHGALQRASMEGKRVDYVGVPFRTDEGPVELRVTVTPLELDPRTPPRFLVAFESRAPRAPLATDSRQVDMGDESRDRIHQLEVDLSYARENLQATLEEMEASNEELQSTNEELVASNEELQSTNEELQSVNEELYTVNSEYQRKIVELTELNADIDNLLLHTDVGVIFLDRELRIRKFTPQVAKTFHLTPADVGRHLESFAHTLDDPALLDDVGRVRDDQQSLQREVRDRKGVPYLLRIVPYRKATGQVDGVVVSLVDVSMLKAAEAQLRRLSRVFQDGADPITIEDLHGVIVDANDEAAATYGYDREELIGRHGSLLMPEELRLEGRLLRERCLHHEKLRNIDTVRVTKDGRRIPVLLTLSLLTDEHRRPAGIATIAKDVTLLKQAESAARDAVRRRDEFLALLSHELRNPLSAVLSAARLINRSLDDPAELASAAESIDRQGWHMARLLDDLLDVSRVTSGKIHLRKEVLDLRQVIADTSAAMRELFDDKLQEFTAILPPKPVVVEGDSARLHQIVENILSNASKYTPDGGRIELSLELESAFASGASDGDGQAGGDRPAPPNQAVLRIRDNGAGIDGELLPAVFDMFTQSERTLARSSGGMGVGLTLVRNLIDLHGGTITAHSDGPLHGSEFVVRLPLSAKPLPQPMTADGPDDAAPKRVLIVEDNADARRSLAMLLKMDGHDVEEAADGESGLAKMIQSPPEVALVDIGLPRVDGYEVARRVRANPNLADVVLVAITGYGQEADRQAVMDAGFDEHLVKPIRPAELASVLADGVRPR